MGQIGFMLILVGAVVSAVAFAWLGAAALRRSPAASLPLPADEPLDKRWLWFLVAIIIGGALIRFIGIDAKGLSHPEAYIPGLDLAPGISEPPPRHGFLETVIWHFYAEPHPFGYYLAMWAWTKAFGATLASIRVPEALLGVLSLFAIYRVGKLSHEPRVGVVAAALLAAHGFHIFWSQVARMYVPGAFLGLVSTWLLLEMHRAHRPRPAIELGYVATNVAGALTVEFFWPLLCTQILWAALHQRAGADRKMSRIGYFQALSFILAAPMLSHAWMTARTEAVPPPTLEFLANFFSFGFLFQHGAYPETVPRLPWAAGLVVLAISLALIRYGLLAPTAEKDEADPPAAPSIGPLVLAAIGVCVLMVGIAGVANVRNEELAALAVLPLLVFAVVWIVARTRSGPARFESLHPLLTRARNLTALIPLQAFVPAILLFAISFEIRLTAPRAFAIFVPYLLIVVAAGVVSMPRRNLAIAALAVIFPASAILLHDVPVAARDYQGLARAINSRIQAGDLIFTQPRDWAYTPMYFYLDHARLVSADYAGALQKAPRSRVWVLSLLNQPPTVEMAAALSGYRPSTKVKAFKAEAVLFVPTP
ncbi:MAG: glycosyltransferase family 39 protein [Betaproteobacteria bacterium]